MKNVKMNLKNIKKIMNKKHLEKQSIKNKYNHYIKLQMKNKK